MNINKLDERMDVTAVASALGVSKSIIYQWHHYGKFADKLPIHTSFNKRIYCLRGDVEKFKLEYIGRRRQRTEAAS